MSIIHTNERSNQTITIYEMDSIKQTDYEHDEQMVDDFVVKLLDTTPFSAKQAVYEAVECYKIAMMLIEGGKAVVDTDYIGEETKETAECAMRAWSVMIGAMTARIRLHRKGIKVTDDVGRTIICENVSNVKKGIMTTTFTEVSKSESKTIKKVIGKENLESLCYGCHKFKPQTCLKKCSVCKCATYCSVECQKADWKNHKQKYH